MEPPEQNFSATSNRKRIVYTLLLVLVVISLRWLDSMTKSERMDARQFASVERARQGNFDVIEQSAKNARHFGIDEMTNYRRTVKALIKAKASPSEIKLRLKNAGFSQFETNDYFLILESTNFPDN